MTRFAVLTTAFLSMTLPGSSFSVPKRFGTTSKTNPSALKDIPDSYVGGFAESNPANAYPKTTLDLSDIPMMSNYENIDKITRTQKVHWTEFSWETVINEPQSRVYMKWHDDISRMGYDDEGRIYSIICPQQGQGSAFIGELNIEATVTGYRGWVKEDEYTMFADLGVIAQIWYTPDVNNPIQKAIAKVLDSKNLPTSKENSIKIPVHNVSQPWNSVFIVQNGTSPEFRQPESTQHDHEAYGVGHLTIDIDEMKKTGNEKVDDFNQVILDIFNIAFGNMLAKGQRVSWNVWTGEPEKVDQDEWRTHSERCVNPSKSTTVTRMVQTNLTISPIMTERH